MEKRQPIDTIWALRVLAAAKRLVTMATWQSFDYADDIEAMVAAMNQTTLTMAHKPAHSHPMVKKHGKRLLNYGLAVLGEPLAALIRPVFPLLHWQHNPNYIGQSFTDKYTHCELIGPDGHALSDNMRLGLMLFDRDTYYPAHQHPAYEFYFVLSGQARFKMEGKPWRSCPIGQFVSTDTNVIHEIQTREDPALVVYWWRGDIKTYPHLL